MVITEYEHWFVVRQSRRRRIYRVTLVATVSRTLRDLSYRSNACPPRELVSCNYGGFIPGVCIAPRCSDPRGIIDRPVTLTVTGA